jgi:DNA-binding transcriptional ArsR family regulator
MQPDEMDAVFQALAHPDRRRMLDIVKNAPGCSVESVCRYFEFSRIAVMKHLRVLAQAGLIHSEKPGRTRQLYFNVVPIQMIYDRWTTDYSVLWARRLTAIKYRVETRKAHKAKPSRRRHG